MHRQALLKWGEQMDGVPVTRIQAPLHLILLCSIWLPAELANTLDRRIGGR